MHKKVKILTDNDVSWILCLLILLSDTLENIQMVS